MIKKPEAPPLFKEIVKVDSVYRKMLLDLRARKVVTISHLRKFKDIRDRRRELIKRAEEIYVGNPKGKNHA